MIIVGSSALTRERGVERPVRLEAREPYLCLVDSASVSRKGSLMRRTWFIAGGA
jgi:hypothetical protein